MIDPGSASPRIDRTTGLFLLVLALCGCTAGPSPLPSPAVPGSEYPELSLGADGRTYMSWIEPGAGSGHRLRWSALGTDGWDEAATVVEGNDWFVNWADFPSVTALGDGTLAAHWLAKSADDTYAYDVWLSTSGNHGAGWSRPVRAHADGTETEHGFVSLVARDDTRFSVVWLDGREMSGGHGQAQGAMTLRHAFLSPQGQVEGDELIDARVCECCATDAVQLDDGSLVVVYRDRSQDEVRDISVARRIDDVWTEPRLVHADDWRIAACPVNGPAIAAQGTSVVVAWFTGIDGGRVRVAFSEDAGASFGEPSDVHAATPIGRVDVVWPDAGRAIVSWVESIEGEAAIRYRTITADGQVGTLQTATATTAGRASGFPRLAAAQGRTVLAWTDSADPSRVRTARLP